MRPAYYDSYFVRLLELAPFERRRGRWQFGTRRISDTVVARLVAGGRARIEPRPEGDLCHRVVAPLITWCWSPDDEDEAWLVEYTAGGPSDCELLIPDPAFAARRRARRAQQYAWRDRQPRQEAAE